MKKIVFILDVLLCVASTSMAQNIPNGTTLPLSPTVSPVTLPSTYTPPPGGYNFRRTFVSFVPTGATFLLVPYTGSPESYGNKVETVYTNGWGDEIQTITRGYPPYTPDVLKPKDRRLSLTNTDFLPYALPACSRFQTTAFSDQQSYYNTNYPHEAGFSYAQTVTSDPSVIPTVNSYAAGSSFVGNSNGNTVTTTINDGTEGIRIYPPPTIGSLTYSAGQLTIKTTLSPHGGQTVEYFDKNNREICKKVWGNCMSSGSDWLTTYYVYDYMGKLANVYTPSASHFLDSDPAWDVSHLTYSYSYNSYGSPVSKTDPGKAGSDYIVYDLKNRPVLYQSPLLATMGKYKFNIYDSRDRVIINGYFTDPNDYNYWQGQLYSPPTSFTTLSLLEIWINGFTGPYPTAIPGCEIEQVNYYDTYPFSCAFVVPPV